MASVKPQQILQLTPTSEIVFEGPFDKVVTSYLELKNPSDERVCFKVKTTAPRRYCVRPNSGIVAPGGKQRIAIMLQPIEQDSQSERSKHKFMVQSTIMSNEDTNLDDVWKRALPEHVMDSKLRCVFQAPVETTQTAPAAATTTSSSSSPSTNTASSKGTEVKINKDILIEGKEERAPLKLVNSTPNEHHRKDESHHLKENAGDISITSASTSTGFGANQIAMGESRLEGSSIDQLTYRLLCLAMLIIGVILGKYII